MNDRIGEKALCPFFRGVIRSKRMVGVECEAPDVNLWFDVTHFTRLRTYQDLTDYTDIFCCDMWQTCPYCKAIMGKF